MLQTKVLEKVTTHILYSVNFPRKSFRLWDNVKRHSRARQGTGGDIVTWREKAFKEYRLS
jgi:hypothetical protein